MDVFQSDQAPLAPKTSDDQAGHNDIKESDLSPAEMQLFREFNDTGDEQISEVGLFLFEEKDEMGL